MKQPNTMTTSKPAWPLTKVTELLNISLPIIQAPMAGGATTPELVAAVSEAGGLGSLGGGYLQPEELRSAIRQIGQLTKQPFAVNLFVTEEQQATAEAIEQARKAVQACCSELHFKIAVVQPPYAPSLENQMRILLEERVPVFSFTFGLPSKQWIDLFKEKGITLIGTATTLEEAKCLEEHKIDLIAAQGSEAGGHRGTFIGSAEDGLIGTAALIPLLVKQLKTPILASGGIMDGRGIAASLQAGASGVQMGTAFLCCTESGIHPLYKKALLNAQNIHTTLTRAFSGKLARGLVNQFIIRMREHETDLLAYPIQNSLTSAMRKEAAKQNRIDFMSLWAGQAVSLCKACPAAQLIKELNEEAGIHLQKFS